MKIKDRYITSIVIDTLALIPVIATMIVVWFFLGQKHDLIFFILMCAILWGWFCFLPLIHKNATIGMKIMGLRIVDKNGNCPPAKLILFRQLNFVTVGEEAKEMLMNNEDWDYIGLKSLGTHIVYIGNEKEEL